MTVCMKIYVSKFFQMAQTMRITGNCLKKKVSWCQQGSGPSVQADNRNMMVEAYYACFRPMMPLFRPVFLSLNFKKSEIANFGVRDRSLMMSALMLWG